MWYKELIYIQYNDIWMISFYTFVLSFTPTDQLEMPIHWPVIVKWKETGKTQMKSCYRHDMWNVFFGKCETLKAVVHFLSGFKLKWE